MDAYLCVLSALAFFYEVKNRLLCPAYIKRSTDGMKVALPQIDSLRENAPDYAFALLTSTSVCGGVLRMSD